MSSQESRKRSVTKAISWRLIVIITESIILYTITKEPITTASFVGIKNVIVFFLYYVHERGWNKLAWER